jgi:hypothetical protein
MTQRINVSLSPDADVTHIESALKSIGASIVRKPSSIQPNLMVVTVEDEHVDRFLSDANRLKGVKVAERDAWQSTF